MPYKSDAQRKFFHAAEDRGDISPKVVDEFDKASKGKTLPEHVKKHENMAEGGTTDETKTEKMPDLESGAEAFENGMDKENVQHDSDTVKSYLASKFQALMHPEDPTKMAEGGYPHVTFLENVSTPEMKKTVHLEDPSGAHGDKIATGHEENYAEGGMVHQAEDRNKEPAKPADIDMAHVEQLNAVYKAMGMGKYALGGAVPQPPVGPQLQMPDQSDPTFWEQVKTALAKAAAPITAPMGVAENVTKATMPLVEAGAPGAVSALNSVTGANMPMPTPSVPETKDLGAPAPLSAQLPSTSVPVKPPVASGAHKAAPHTPESNELSGMFNQDTSKLTEGVEASDRQKLADTIAGRQSGTGSILAQALAGIGDALAAKGGREQHSLKDIFTLQKQQRDEALSNFDKARQDRLEKLDIQTKMGNNTIQKLAAEDAYGVDENLNKQLGAPPGTAHKDLPLYMQMVTAKVAQQEKDSDLYMKAHAQAANEVEASIKNAGVFNFKPSPEQIKAAGAKLADNYYNRAKGNVLFHSSDGQRIWLGPGKIAAAQKMDPAGQIIP